MKMRGLMFATLLPLIAAVGCGDGTLPAGDTGNDTTTADVINDGTMPVDTGSDTRDAVTNDVGENDADAVEPTDVPGDTQADVDVAENLDAPPYARFINPFIGTQDGLFNVGNTFPGPGLPFGMVRLSPDTGDKFGAGDYSHCGGYRWADPLIYGFSHNHLHGTGAPDYGDFLVMPVREVTAAKTKLTTFASEYDKASEKAEAGYYTVTLTDPDVRVELTATTRCGYHRYTFPEGETTGAITIDYGASLVEGRSLGGSSHMAEDGSIEVLNHHLGDFASRFGGYDVYAVVKFSAVPNGYGVWKDGVLTPDHTDIVIPKDVETKWGGWFEFDLTENHVIEMQVCLSYTSEVAARANMAAEIPAGATFESTRTAAFNAWEAFVNRFETVGGDINRKTNFYTALYHSAQMPQVWSDVAGTYQGFDKAVHSTDGWKYYTDLSLWDTFRTQQPLIALVWPEVHRDINRSMLEMARQSGNFPMWALAAGDTGSMIGQHAATIIADSYLKGITDFDVDESFDILAACANDTLPDGVRGTRGGAATYNATGYVPAEEDDTSVSVTLEYAFCDYCLAELAGAIGRTDDEAVFRARSHNYHNVWDPDIMFFREKNADGSWTAAVEDFDPTVMTFGGKNQGYTEGSGWQYRWFVPQYPDDLVSMYGTPDTFVSLLNEFFQVTRDSFNFQVPGGWYYQGNEPDIHAPFMFIAAGRHDLTNYWARWVLDANYRNEPEGLVGNDDAGTLAAWYVFAASGLFPSPCKPGYFITSPAFDKVTIKLPGGDLVIDAPGASGDAVYVTAATFNGTPVDLTESWLTHEAIKNGGTLSLTVSATPPTL